MIPEEDRKVQEFVHQIEAGGLKNVILRALFIATVAGLAALYLFVNFRGLDSETAMDQAQIGRQIAARAGFTTFYLRPLAVWQFLNHRETLPQGLMPDIYNFPLNPLLNAVVLRPIKRWWPMQPTDTVYIGDMAIAATGIALFIASVFILFFLVRALFDARIAWMSCGLVFLTDLLWRFSTSGLPQMLVLFFFTAALWILHRAMEAREEDRTGRMLLLLAAAAVLFGLMTLAQPLCSWIFLGFLVFVFSWFQPRAVSGLLVLVALVNWPETAACVALKLTSPSPTIFIQFPDASIVATLVLLLVYVIAPLLLVVGRRVRLKDASPYALEFGTVNVPNVGTTMSETVSRELTLLLA